MATYNKFQQFVEDVAQGVHDLTPSTGHTLKVALTNTLPVNTSAVLADLTGVIAAPAVDSDTLTINAASGQTAGTYKLVLDDLLMTASGSVGPFRYVVVYNDTPTSPADPLIAWYDYGSSITLSAGEKLNLDFDATTGVLTLGDCP